MNQQENRFVSEKFCTFAEISAIGYRKRFTWFETFARLGIHQPANALLSLCKHSIDPEVK